MRKRFQTGETLHKELKDARAQFATTVDDIVIAAREREVDVEDRLAQLEAELKTIGDVYAQAQSYGV